MPKQKTTKLGQLLIDLRTRKNISRREAAAAIGFTDTCLAHLEAGRAKNPRFATIVALSAFYKVPLKRFIV